MRLERFRDAKQVELARLRAAAEKGALPEPWPAARPDYAAALKRRASGSPLAVVAEYKRASPSAGVICEDLEVEEVVRQYAAAHASCLSILTEEAHFAGHISFLSRAAGALHTAASLPLLRKDFIFDPLQIRATAATPASALLLIVRLTPDALFLRRLREDAASLGLACVVEVFDAVDLRIARESGAAIIQVNARDLRDFSVNRGACLALARACPPERGEIWVAASGICAHSHLCEAGDAGFDAVLVGTALMRGGRPGEALGRLLHNRNPEEVGDAGQSLRLDAAE